MSGEQPPPLPGAVNDSEQQISPVIVVVQQRSARRLIEQETETPPAPPPITVTAVDEPLLRNAAALQPTEGSPSKERSSIAITPAQRWVHPNEVNADEEAPTIAETTASRPENRPGAGDRLRPSGSSKIADSRKDDSLQRQAKSRTRRSRREGGTRSHNGRRSNSRRRLSTVDPARRIGSLAVPMNQVQSNGWGSLVRPYIIHVAAANGGSETFHNIEEEGIFPGDQDGLWVCSGYTGTWGSLLLSTIDAIFMVLLIMALTVFASYNGLVELMKPHNEQSLKVQWVTTIYSTVGFILAVSLPFVTVRYMFNMPVKRPRLLLGVLVSLWLFVILINFSFQGAGKFSASPPGFSAPGRVFFIGVAYCFSVLVSAYLVSEVDEVLSTNPWPRKKLQFVLGLSAPQILIPLIFYPVFENGLQWWANISSIVQDAGTGFILPFFTGIFLALSRLSVYMTSNPHPRVVWAPTISLQLTSTVCIRLLIASTNSAAHTFNMSVALAVTNTAGRCLALWREAFLIGLPQKSLTAAPDGLKLMTPLNPSPLFKRKMRTVADVLHVDIFAEYFGIAFAYAVAWMIAVRVPPYQYWWTATLQQLGYFAICVCVEGTFAVLASVAAEAFVGVPISGAFRTDTNRRFRFQAFVAFTFAILCFPDGLTTVHNFYLLAQGCGSGNTTACT